jgi:NADH-quinone oxidoreductase subunit N
LKAGVILVAIGMAFKVAAVPFHFWAPDVYHGSPTIITAYMITTIKVAGFAALLRLTLYCFGSNSALWSQSLAVIAALSIMAGNLGALSQTRVKRMLAYSSIAHTGYIMIALVSLQAKTPSILFFYSAAYISSNLAIFTVLIILKKTIKNSALEAFDGLAKLNPLMAICTAIAFLSLTGIPPLAGFIAKYIVFASAVNEGYLWLVIIAVLGSVVSIFYYFRPVINMYMKEKDYDYKIITTRLSLTVLVILTACTIVIGLIPWLLFKY